MIMRSIVFDSYVYLRIGDILLALHLDPKLSIFCATLKFVDFFESKLYGEKNIKISVRQGVLGLLINHAALLYIKVTKVLQLPLVHKGGSTESL